MNFDFYHKDSCVLGRCNSCVWGSGWGEARQLLLSPRNPEHLVNKQFPRGKEERQNSYASKQCGRVQPNRNCCNCGSYHTVLISGQHTTTQTSPFACFCVGIFPDKDTPPGGKNTIKTQNVYESYTKLFAQTILTGFLRRGIKKKSNTSEPHDRVFPTGQQGTHNITH